MAVRDHTYETVGGEHQVTYGEFIVTTQKGELRCACVNPFHASEAHTDGYAYYSPERRQYLHRSEIQDARPV